MGVFSKAWLRALTPANIVAGFKKCGIHPFNCNVIPILETADMEHDANATDSQDNDGSSSETPFLADIDFSAIVAIEPIDDGGCLSSS